MIDSRGDWPVVGSLQQASILGNLGCDFLQGYLYGRPEDAERSEQLLHEPLLNLPAREDQTSPDQISPLPIT